MITVLQTNEFVKWLKRLKDVEARARILVRIRRLSLTENFGDAKSVGDGVYEMRIEHGPGYRLYYARRDNAVVLLLIGGDKSSQQRDIAKAKKLNLEYRRWESAMKKATSWDAADYLETEADIAAYLNAAFEDGDTSVIAAALGDVARAKGMTQLAKETGITRDGLYKALSPTGNPSFDTVQKILRAFGLRLDVATSAQI